MAEDVQDTLPPRHKRLKNGAIYSLDAGRIVGNPGGGTTAITSELSSKYKQERKERKRRALAEAANRVAEQAGWDGKGDMDYVEAIGEAVTAKALNATDPKQVEAARFIFKETGILEDDVRVVKQGEGALAELGAETLRLLLAEAHRRRALTVDAEIVDDDE